MHTIELTADEKFSLFNAITCKVVQIERYIETRKKLVDDGLALPNDKFLRDSEDEIKKLNALCEKVLNC